MSMDRRHFDAREKPSTSKEVNSGSEKTNGSRDIVKDAHKKTEEFKLEKLKLEKAWKEQKECNEDLTRYIKTDNWDQSIERLRAYIEIFQDKELNNKIRDSSSKVLMTPSERQGHNLSSQSFQQSLQKQVGYLSERSFQECLQKGDLEKAREHIEKLKTINKNFRDSLVKLDVTLTAERRSIDQENQKLEQKIDEIKPKDVKLSRLTRIKDALIGPHEHRPERVNNITAKFKENVNYIKKQIDSDSLPENLKGKLIEMTLSFIHDFKKFSAQAVRGYGEGSKGRQSREEGEASINDLNQRIQEMSADLPMWKDVKKFQDSIKKAPASSSNDTISDIEQLVADKVVDDLKQAHMRVLNCYRRPSDSPLFETFLQNAHHDLKKSSEQFKILSGDHSDKWRKIHEVRAQLEADYGEVTQEDMRIKLLADKAINRAKEAYKEVLDWYQQSGGRPEHLHGTYKQLEEAGEQLETLREASHVWKQINEIQTEFVGTLREQKEVYKAEGAFNRFLDRYEQGKNDWQIYKQPLERACKSLKDIRDLREDWSNEVNAYDNLLEDVSKTHNNMEIFAFAEEDDREHLADLINTSLEDKNFAKAREHINQLKKVNEYLKELKQQESSSLLDSEIGGNRQTRYADAASASGSQTEHGRTEASTS